jgi:hypothetical protein
MLKKQIIATDYTDKINFILFNLHKKTTYGSFKYV